MTTPDTVGKHLSNETEARLRAEVERNTAPFRTPDIAGLCERLRAVESSGHGGVTTNWNRNPDGPQAAATIERQAAEIERLRAALVRIGYHPTGGTGCNPEGFVETARAALTGEDAAGSPTSQNTEPCLPFSDAGEP
jgi:hypothetical protein